MRIRGAIALVLGIVGALLAAATAIAAILFVFGANNIVDEVVERVNDPISRVDERVSEASTAVEGASGDELNARISGVKDQADAAQAGLGTIVDHPLYGRLPVDTDALESRVQLVVDEVEAIGDVGSAEVSAQDRTRIRESLDGISETLDGVDTPVTDIADSLRFWIRLSGLGFILLAAWGLWGQVLLARQGRRWMKG